MRGSFRINCSPRVKLNFLFVGEFISRGRGMTLFSGGVKIMLPAYKVGVHLQKCGLMHVSGRAKLIHTANEITYICIKLLFNTREIIFAVWVHM
jgi:hypothetical protein